MPMIETAEIVAERYGIRREAQDEYALESQRRTAAAQQAGRFDAEIVPIERGEARHDKETGEIARGEVTLTKDEGNRPDTTLEGLAEAQAGARRRQVITAGNASQLSDGASACVVMDAEARREARPAAARHLPRLRGRRLRARRDGHRPGLRRAAPAGAPRPQGRATSTCGS